MKAYARHDGGPKGGMDPGTIPRLPTVNVLLRGFCCTMPARSYPSSRPAQSRLKRGPNPRQASHRRELLQAYGVSGLSRDDTLGAGCRIQYALPPGPEWMEPQLCAQDDEWLADRGAGQAWVLLGTNEKEGTRDRQSERDTEDQLDRWQSAGWAQLEGPMSSPTQGSRPWAASRSYPSSENPTSLPQKRSSLCCLGRPDPRPRHLALETPDTTTSPPICPS